MKKLLSFILICIFLPILASDQAHASESIKYVALGDSIAAYFGLNEGEGYVELLAEKLRNEGGYESVALRNLAVSGYDSAELLELVDANEETIRNADLVTVCIGGNNFLGTLITGMVSPLGLSQGSLINQGYALFNIEISDDMSRIAAAGLEAPAIQASLAHGIAQFRADLPVIISRIRSLAPDADIYFMTVYNPLEETHPVYPLIDPIMRQINALIYEMSDITVVDTYAMYEGYNGKGVKDTLSLGSIDPHPSALGQRLIANAHYKAITGMESIDIVDIKPVQRLPETKENAPQDEGAVAALTPDANNANERTPIAATQTQPEDKNDSSVIIIIMIILLVAVLGILASSVKRKKK